MRQLLASETDPLLERARASRASSISIRELDRCRRTGAGLVIALVEVVGLEGADDERADAARDELLGRLVALTRAHLRSY